MRLILTFFKSALWPVGGHTRVGEVGVCRADMMRRQAQMQDEQLRRQEESVAKQEAVRRSMNRLLSSCRLSAHSVVCLVHSEWQWWICSDILL